MFAKMRNHLLVVNMVILSLIMFISFATIYAITYSSVIRENEQKLNAIPSINIKSDEAIEPNPDAPIYEEKRMNTLLGGSAMLPVDYANSFVIEIDGNGEIKTISSHINMPEEVYKEAAVVGEKASTGKITLEGRVWQYKKSSSTWIRTIRDENGESTNIEEKQNIIAFLDITDSMNSLTKLLITFLAAGTLMLAVLFAVSFYFASRSIKPIENMWNKQKQFIADASHELKTPLFSIKSNLAAIRANQDETVKSQQKWINHADSSISSMDKLIGDLLYLAAAETVKEAFVPFNLSLIVENAVTTFEASAYEKGIKLNYTVIPETYAIGDEEKLRQVVFILLDNAIKYTYEGGVIEIAVSRTKNHVKLMVSNTGQTISKDDLPKIFDRFYRADKSRSNEIKGYGLGLSIAKTIVERSGGEIKAESSDNKTVFTVILKVHE